MLRAIREFLENAFPAAADGNGDPAARAKALRVATAALLVEMSRADHRASRSERNAILDLLARDFSLDASQAQSLLDQAEGEADEAVSLHEFTALLHKHLSEADKLRVVEMLWQVALADGRIDKYEDYLVRKVADLLYVSHKDLVRLRHGVEVSARRDQ